MKVKVAKLLAALALALSFTLAAAPPHAAALTPQINGWDLPGYKPAGSFYIAVTSQATMGAWDNRISSFKFYPYSAACAILYTGSWFTGIRWTIYGPSFQSGPLPLDWDNTISSIRIGNTITYTGGIPSGCSNFIY